MGNSALRRKYKNPAVQEAIFEAKFTFESFGIATPGQIYEQIKNNYPNKRDIKHVPIFLESSVNNTEQLPFLVQAPLIQARKEDDSELLQIGPGIAVANRLKYTSWEDFIPGIHTILNAYICSAKPKFVTRIGTRYINRFLLPQGIIDIKDYFNLDIQIPTTLFGLQQFDLTFINKIKNVNDQLNQDFDIRIRFFTDALKSDETGNKLILDLDCYVNADFAPDVKEITHLATQAHDTLEMVFENIITDKARDLMGEENA